MQLSQAKALLRYDPKVGRFYWKVTRQRVKAGEMAGHQKKNGYRSIRILGVDHYEHRLVWLFEKGVWPTKHIDHKDGDPSNNNINNLREVTAQENQNNQARHRAGKLVGSTQTSTGRWRAAIRLNGKRLSLGCFATEEEAHHAYMQAKMKTRNHRRHSW